jgi:RES domain-containing protein
MAPLPAALLGAAAASAPLLAWRIDAQPYADRWHSGIGAELYGGRWNPKGQRAVYCSLDPATCLVESAVHRGFEVLDTRPHVLSCLQITPLPTGEAGVHVVQPDALPNPAWLHGGTPSAGQQRFGAELLAAHGVVLFPSAVSRCSWNLVFSPEAAAGRWRLAQQQRLVVDTRLNLPRG